MPSHNHSGIRGSTYGNISISQNGGSGGPNFGLNGTTGTGPGAGTTNQMFTTNTGGGQAHNNMPPYITCYIWRRTA